MARGPGRQHVPLPCVVAGLLQRADPHGPHTTRHLGMQRAQAAFHLGEMGMDAEDGYTPHGARGPLPRDANASRVDTRAWHDGDRPIAARLGADRGTTSLVTCMLLIVTCRILC